MVLALIIVSLGITQSIFDPSIVNPAHPVEDIRLLSNLFRVSATGAIAYRPNSVFVSAGRYANSIMVAWLLVLGFSGYVRRQKRGRALAVVAIAVTAAGTFLTVCRV